jgi:hypothetical protein
MAIGVPLGIWAAHKPNVYRIMLPVVDLMQTLPTFVCPLSTGTFLPRLPVLRSRLCGVCDRPRGRPSIVWHRLPS